MTITEQADALVHGDRARDYGDIHESFGRIAELWSVLLKTEISAKQVALCMMALKLSRLVPAYKEDSIVDFAGYEILAEILKDK